MYAFEHVMTNTCLSFCTQVCSGKQFVSCYRPKLLINNVTTWINTSNFTHTNAKKWSVNNFWQRERQRIRVCVCVCVCVLSVLDFLLAFPYSNDLITNSVHCVSSWCNSLGYVHSVTVLALFLAIDFLFSSNNFSQCLKHLQTRVVKVCLCTLSKLKLLDNCS